MKRREFTPQDDARIREMAASGCSMQETANALGRSKGVICGRARLLGVHFTDKTIWTAEQDRLLRECIAAGGGYAAGAAATGRTKPAVAWRIRQLGLRVDPEARAARLAETLRTGPNRPGLKPGSAAAKAQLPKRIAGYLAWWASLSPEERAERVQRMSKACTPEVRRETGRKVAEAKLPQLPAHEMEDYRFLTRVKKFRRDEALQIIRSGRRAPNPRRASDELRRRILMLNQKEAASCR
jgi:hypothetical protein